MKKTAVVYWSSTGNTEAMAQAVLEGMKEAGAEAVLLTPDAVDVGALAGMDAIAFGYNNIMKKSSASVVGLKDIINPTGMSMNDKERIDLVNRVYREMTHYKELANYYTRKNLHVSYLRAKEKNEQQQVFDLYGKDERYW